MFDVLNLVCISQGIDISMVCGFSLSHSAALEPFLLTRRTTSVFSVMPLQPCMGTDDSSVKNEAESHAQVSTGLRLFRSLFFALNTGQNYSVFPLLNLISSLVNLHVRTV